MMRHAHGFTLVEMIIVIVITGIVAGMVAVFMRAPVQGYVDSARRAEMTDIADTALRRISRDVHLALPNSVRVSGACGGAGTCFLEFIPTTGGGRYRSSVAAAGAPLCGTLAADVLNFSAADTCFEVLGPMPPVAVGDGIVVYNLGMPGADAYVGLNRRAVTVVGAGSITIASAAPLPFDSCVEDAAGNVAGGCRFQVVVAPVTYACDPGAGTLTRWTGYGFLAAPPGALPGGGVSTTLATNVSACNFIYTVGAAQGAALLNTSLTISSQGESVALFNATHVNNVP